MRRNNLFKRTVFGQNLRAGRCFIEKGGNGIPADKLDTVLGKKINKDIGKEHVFNEKDFFD